MANDMIIPDNFGQVPEIFKGETIDVSRFTAGIGMAWPILTLRGKEWGWRFRGVDFAYTAPDASAGGAHMPVRALDVVLVDAGNRISKVYYKNGYKPGERTPPECWSSDGVVPDDGSAEKQSKTCRGCRWNVFGSRLGDGGQKGKACSDNKRLAVVTMGDLQNTDFGGPFMLRLPPGSFANYTTYVSVMASRGFQPFSIVTRMMFGPEAHPKVIFQPVRALSNPEALIIKAHQDNPRTSEMLNDKAMGAFLDPDAADEDGVVGTLPPANDPGAQTQGGGWKAPQEQAAVVQQAQPEPQKPQLTPAQRELADLKAKLAAAELAAAEPEPEPEPTPPALTPEQLEIAALKAKLAEVEGKKPRGRPRTKPVAPPVTQAGNGQAPNGQAPDEPPANPVGNAIADRIAGLVGKTS